MAFPKRVLIVEDNYEKYYSLQFIILQLASDISLTHHSGSRSALKHLSESNAPLYDMIFLNWGMPEISGRECVIGMRLLPFYAHVPIVVYSSLDEKPDYEEVMRLGAAYFFLLPDSSIELLHEVQKIFSLYQYFASRDVAGNFEIPND
ncbi:MAG TPA: response regulator [Niastella sp.]